MDVQMPIPKRDKFEEILKRERFNPIEEYHGLALAFFFLVILFAIWYFYPRKRPEIAAPRSYMDARGMSHGPVGGVAVGTSRSRRGQGSAVGSVGSARSRGTRGRTKR